ncbi:MAG: glycoside hydrolase family 140 protein [Bacillota bacterium]
MIGRFTLLMPLVLVVLSTSMSTMAAAPRLKVSDNNRYLVYEDGRPFFYLGDTAWELFHRLNREEADRYLENRARKGFTVIQAVAIGEVDGHNAPNAYGHVPLVDLDPARPAIKDGPQNDYWDHVDYIVNKANSLGLTIGFLPTWGRYWHDKIQDNKPLFTVQNAETYGQWLGTRYKDKSIIWILGGDRSIDNDEQKATIRAMARGLRKGDGGAHLITFHPQGGAGSSQWLHNDEWLDFNMRQNGHAAEFTGRYDNTHADYNRTPIKPVIDGEPIYEDHPVSFNAKSLGHSIAADVRRPLYWDLFNGACGHTYGHHSVWQMWQPGRSPINNPLMPWYEAIDQPGAGQMQFGRWLIESRPFLTRIPDGSIIVTDRVPTSVPGAGRYRFAATRDEAGTFAMVYAPIGRAFSVRMDTIKSPKVKAWWFNPRDGKATLIGEFANTGVRQFISPNPGEELDWVLVLDDAARNYPPPGQHQ